MHKSVRHSSGILGIEAISIISDRTFLRHTHDEFGIGFLVEGGQESWRRRGLVEGQAGDIITVNPGELHDGIGRQGETRHWRMLFISSEAVTDLMGRPAAQVEFCNPVLRDPCKTAQVAQAVAAMTSDVQDTAQIEELLMRAVRCLADDTGIQQLTKLQSADVAMVMDQIKEDFASPLVLSDYAETTGLSRYQILRRFAQEVGTTPHAYLTQHRVKEARRYLRAGILLAEAALASGFADQSHMTRAFVEQLGMTPGKYIAAGLA